MKKLFSLSIIAALVACMMISCSGGDSIKATQKSINGDLKDYYEVVEKDYKVNDKGMVNIELKRIKEGMPGKWDKKMNMGVYTEGAGVYEIAFIAEFLDKDDNVIEKVSSSIVEDLQSLQDIVAINVDETSSISFKVPEKAEKFRMRSIFKCDGAESAEASSDDNHLKLSGTIGSYPVNMVLNIDGAGDVTGAYYYQKKGPGNLLALKGSRADNGEISLAEFDNNGACTGFFVGKVNNGVFSGVMTVNSNGKQLSYNLKSDETIAIPDLGKINFGHLEFDAESNYDTDVEFSEGDGDSDIDEFLDAYERYFDKYISLLKKANAGDPTALAEYAGMYQELINMQKKLEGKKSQMTMEQIQRLNKISAKLMKAAQEMR